LHYHGTLEAYYLLAGKTQFVYLKNNVLVKTDLEAGQWHFNPPFVPHAISTPHGEPHLSLWFREGGSGQAANNAFGPKWIGDVAGLKFVSKHAAACEEFACACKEEVRRWTETDHLIGSLGFVEGKVMKTGAAKFFRTLQPEQFDVLADDEDELCNLETFLRPKQMKQLLASIAEKRLEDNPSLKERMDEAYESAMLSADPDSDPDESDAVA
jgi:hypothetical protein